MEEELNMKEELMNLQSKINSQNLLTTSLSKEIHELSQAIIKSKEKLEEEKKNRQDLEQIYLELDAKINFLNSNISQKRTNTARIKSSKVTTKNILLKEMQLEKESKKNDL